MQADQEHAVNGLGGVLGGDVLEVGVDHRRARPAHRPAAYGVVLPGPGCLGFDPGPVGVVLAVADVHVRPPALTARGLLAQVQVDQAQPAQLTDPEPAVGQPRDHHPVPRARHRPQQHLPGALGKHFRVPAHLFGGRERVGRHAVQDVPEHRPPPIRPRRQPCCPQRLHQCRVHAVGAQAEVEALQASRRGLQRTVPIGALALPPRQTERPRVVSSESRHVVPQVLKRHRPCVQPREPQPPQMIHQHIRVRPVRTRPAGTQEPVRLRHKRAVGVHDRVGHPPVSTHDLLHP